ncbi:MAG TPA: hypothetical protein VF573_29455 [Paraburkholderia sp.]|uniref:DUF2515 family protein n=1 Tax=Paraburkholderia sp. TaxID=1926495 RepID=UPI002ED00A94
MAQLDMRIPVLKDGTPDYRTNSHTVSDTPIDPGEASYVARHYGARARRVASSYARMFLEEFHLGGGKEKIGRFYWTGLGAFAAKQVAANIESWQVNAPGMDVVHEGLGKGNLWIYNDLLPWCYGYAADPTAFEGCAPKRDSEQFDPAVKGNLMRQQWAAEVMPRCPVVITPSANDDDSGTGNPTQTLGNFRCTSRVLKGFACVRQWELETEEDAKAALAFKHLWIMAQHEQGEVLQGILYDDESFRDKLLLQRVAERATATHTPWGKLPTGIPVLDVIHALIPPLQLSFTAEDNAWDMQYRFDAPDDLVLEDYVQRMAWIKDTATLFHTLMLKKRRYMLGELRTIASWGGLT